MAGWGDFLHGIEAIPGLGAAPAFVHGIVRAARGGPVGGEFQNIIPGYGIANAVRGEGGGMGGGSSGGDPSAGSSLESFLAGRIPGMSYEQVFGGDPQGASATAQAIESQLKGMPAADAQKFIASLQKAYPGSPLITDITNAQQAPATGAPVNPFDTIGKILQGFSNQALPWLSQQMQTSDKGSANLAAQMQSALSGASPAMRQAYSVGIPELQSANLTMDKAAQSSLATQPQWDTLISGLTDAAAAYKAAATGAQAEPYWAATTGVGAAPSSSSPGQQALSTLQQQILGAQAATH